jgi:decaprenylphospho-beta-D-ribofuranose 2-oxidase
MGGQAFYKDAIVLDMRSFNKIISLDEINKTITVQSGATWYDIQLYLNSKNLAVKAMQSTNIFTVGGSLSVNAHGMDHQVGSIASTVKSFTMMMADGTIKNIDRETNLELFNLAIGGYGLFGIILEVKLKITDNVMLLQEIKKTNLKQFINYFKQIQSDNS